jgi:hypothetical protein
MSSLADLPELVGFLSYARDDDEDSNGALSALREKIQRELRAQLGRSSRDFRIWQDTEAIPAGALWAEEIKQAINQAVFFIPIITPQVVRSQWLRFELDAFAAREKVLGRDDLIFPILYITVPELEDERKWANDPALQFIATRQYLDYRRIRHFDPTSIEVTQAIEKLCVAIAAALRRPWISPEERRAIEKERRAEEERRRAQADATRHAEEEGHQKVVEAQRRAEEERAKKEAERAEQKLREKEERDERQRVRQYRGQSTAGEAAAKIKKGSRKIVISYRRNDSKGATRAIVERLERKYGKKSVFMDVKTPYGIDFREHIHGMLQECDVLLAIVGRKWRGEKKGGIFRTFNDEDYVRIEIETALQRKIFILPVLIDGASMPTKKQLPESIQDFSFRNAAEVDSGRNFADHMKALMQGMDEILRKIERPSDNASTR